MGPSAFEGYIFPSMPIWTVTGGNQLLSLHCFASVQLAHGYVSQSNSAKKECSSIVVFGVGLFFFFWATVTLSKTLGNARAPFNRFLEIWRGSKLHTVSVLVSGRPNSPDTSGWFRCWIPLTSSDFLWGNGGMWVDITQWSHIKISFSIDSQWLMSLRMFRWVETIESLIVVQIRAGNWTFVAQIVRISHDINFTRL